MPKEAAYCRVYSGKLSSWRCTLTARIMAGQDPDGPEEAKGESLIDMYDKLFGVFKIESGKVSWVMWVWFEKGNSFAVGWGCGVIQNMDLTSVFTSLAQCWAVNLAVN